MKIAFFIGNGFDVALGLETRYSDFLKEYVNKDSNSETVKSFKEKIATDVEAKKHNWADLELEFGNYTECLSKEEEIIEIYNDCIDSIGKYIEKELDKINFEQCNDKISSAFAEYLKNLYQDLPRVTKDYFIKTSEINSIAQDIVIDFISFNYTNCIEKCIEYLKVSKSQIDSHSDGNHTRTTKAGAVNYVHGTIAEKNPIFGLNDENQIKFNGSLSNQVKRRIIKPQKNDALARGTNETIGKIIEQTRVFCIFGMSIGDTDNYWWEKIGKMLKEHAHVQVIYYVFNSAINFNNFTADDEKLDIEEKYRDYLINKFGFSEEEKKNLEKNIHIIVNSNIFQLNLVNLTNEFGNDEVSIQTNEKG